MTVSTYKPKSVVTVDCKRVLDEVRRHADRISIDLNSMSDVELYNALKALHQRGMTEAARLGLPARLYFENVGGSNVIRRKYRYEYLGYRAPKKGEHYISGAIPEAYKAPNDLTSFYHICKPILED